MPCSERGRRTVYISDLSSFCVDSWLCVLRTFCPRYLTLRLQIPRAIAGRVFFFDPPPKASCLRPREGILPSPREEKRNSKTGVLTAMRILLWLRGCRAAYVWDPTKVSWSLTRPFLKSLSVHNLTIRIFKRPVLVSVCIAGAIWCMHFVGALNCWVRLELLQLTTCTPTQPLCFHVQSQLCLSVPYFWGWMMQESTCDIAKFSPRELLSALILSLNRTEQPMYFYWYKTS